MGDVHELLDGVEAIRGQMKTLVQMAEATKRLDAPMDKGVVLQQLQAGYEALEEELNRKLQMLAARVSLQLEQNGERQGEVTA